ncbi:MAG: DUF4345 domain-containing protein [Hyphomonadaceae bacterium]
MLKLSAFLRPFAFVFFAVGLLHLALGPGADVLLGAELSGASRSDPVLDSQNRFYGVSFMLYGALFQLCADDLRKHAAVFRITCIFFLLGGLARLVSIAAVGLPSVPILALMASEIIGGPLLLWWHARTTRD